MEPIRYFHGGYGQFPDRGAEPLQFIVYMVDPGHEVIGQVIFLTSNDQRFGFNVLPVAHHRIGVQHVTDHRPDTRIAWIVTTQCLSELAANIFKMRGRPVPGVVAPVPTEH